LNLARFQGAYLQVAVAGSSTNGGRVLTDGGSEENLSHQAAIIVPVRVQQDDFLAHCLDSAVRQTTPCQILVVTSDQTPRSNLDLIRQYEDRFPHVISLPRQRPSFAAAINTGIGAAEATRVGLLLSDDWLDARAVERCLTHDADIVSTDMAIYDEAGTRRLGLRKPRSKAAYDQLQNLQDRAVYLGHFLLFRRDRLLSIGGVDETIGNVGPDDFDLIWSLLEVGASAAIVEEMLYCYRDHPGERLTLRPKADQLRDLEKILDKHGVFGAERERSIACHARWFGRTLQDVVASGKS
jgi:glycosyltransferase involved in cell wall biosynthesis